MEWNHLIYLYMKIKKLVFLVVFLMMSSVTRAQTYTVYSVIGNAKVVNGKKTSSLQPRKLLNINSRLLIEPESAVILLDDKSNKMYSFAAEGSHTVKQLIDMTRNSVKTISKQYMNYLVNQLFSDASQQMVHPDTYMQVTATSYRSSSNDSLLLTRISQLFPDQVGAPIEELLCRPETKIETDMDVHFELISCDTGLAVDRNVKANTGTYLRVHNGTNEIIYVNVLDIDENGNKYLVLPVDSAATCAHLLVPPMSTISFRAYPFVFSDEPIKETFIMVATEEPVDFSILMNPIRRGGKKSMKSGLYRNIYRVE